MTVIQVGKNPIAKQYFTDIYGAIYKSICREAKKQSNLMALRGSCNIVYIFCILEAMLSNGERVCVTRKYLKDIKEALLRRNG